MRYRFCLMAFRMEISESGGAIVVEVVEFKWVFMSRRENIR